MPEPLDGLRILILEDEFLIALDVEQLCRDHGARDVTIVRSIAELGEDQSALPEVDAAVLDVMLGGVPTFGVAAKLRERGVPFVFASGYTERAELADFPEAELVGKPYSGNDLVKALARAKAR